MLAAAVLSLFLVPPGDDALATAERFCEVLCARLDDLEVPGEFVALLQGWLAGLVERELPPAVAPLEIDLRVAPLADLWFEVRARAERPPSDEADLLAPAVTAMRALGKALGSALAFGRLESALEGTPDAQALRAVFAELPERGTPRVPGAREIELRRLAVAVADALAEVEPAWRASAWPARRKVLDRRRLELGARLASDAGGAARRHLVEALGFDVELRAEVPVYLTVHAGWPGGVTHLRRGGGGVCFVSLEDRGEGILLETLLHESLHALDVLTRDGTDLLDTLEARLVEAGLDRRDRALRSWVHTLFFVHAADTVRSFLVPDHVDYGDVEGYYERLAEISELERGLWADYRAGTIDAEELMEAIVDAATGR